MKNPLEYLFLIIIYSLNAVTWPSRENHILQPVLEIRLYLKAALADRCGKLAA